MYAKVTGFGNLEYASTGSKTAAWDLLNNNNDFTGNMIITRGRLRINPGGTQSDAGLGNAGNDVIFNVTIKSKYCSIII